MNIEEREQLIFRVAQFAKKYHEGQTRQDNTTPYITHPIEVATLLRMDGFNWEMQCAAYLHDAIEDCEDVTNTSLCLDLHAIGLPLASTTRIVTMVEGMTSPDKQFNVTKEFKRAERKKMMRAHLEIFGWEVSVIKIYDRYTNVMDMQGFEEGFKTKYAQETLDLARTIHTIIGNSNLAKVSGELFTRANNKTEDVIKRAKEILGK